MFIERTPVALVRDIAQICRFLSVGVSSNGASLDDIAECFGGQRPAAQRRQMGGIAIENLAVKGICGRKCAFIAQPFRPVETLGLRRPNPASPSAR